MLLIKKHILKNVIKCFSFDSPCSANKDEALDGEQKISEREQLESTNQEPEMVWLTARLPYQNTFQRRSSSFGLWHDMFPQEASDREEGDGEEDEEEVEEEEMDAEESSDESDSDLDEKGTDVYYEIITTPEYDL